MVTITISGAEKSGGLARITAFFVRSGYPLKGQQLVESPSGAKLVKISLDLTQLDKVKLAAEIKSLSPDFKVVSVEGSQSGSVPSIKEIATQFPDVAPLVQAYGESFGADTRDTKLAEAGKKIGAFQYEKEWSFGSPLKMPVALRRTLVPALEALGKVDATDTELTLLDSPFCGTGKIPCCEFLTGFMQGFLDAGPLSTNATVQKTACRASGDTHCTYTVAYEV